jgi:hypothetical protein
LDDYRPGHFAVGGTAKLAAVFGQARVTALQSLANEDYSKINNQNGSAAFQLASWAIMFGDQNSNGTYSLEGSSFYSPSTNPGL